jgi:hypothetical protein
VGAVISRRRIAEITPQIFECPFTPPDRNTLIDNEGNPIDPTAPNTLTRINGALQILRTKLSNLEDQTLLNNLQQDYEKLVVRRNIHQQQNSDMIVAGRNRREKANKKGL